MYLYSGSEDIRTINSYNRKNKNKKCDYIEKSFLQNEFCCCAAQSNPTIVSYNASAVKIYNGTSSLHRWCVLKAKIFSSARKSALAYYKLQISKS
jgi:hypothetical protein